MFVIVCLFLFYISKNTVLILPEGSPDHSIVPLPTDHRAAPLIRGLLNALPLEVSYLRWYFPVPRISTMTDRSEAAHHLVLECRFAIPTSGDLMTFAKRVDRSST